VLQLLALQREKKEAEETHESVVNLVYGTRKYMAYGVDECLASKMMVYTAYDEYQKLTFSKSLKIYSIYHWLL